jgi:hypothetical protein
MPGLFPNPLYLTKTKRSELETLSTDEMTGVQALERKAPDLPLAPGKVQLVNSNISGMARRR